MAVPRFQLFTAASGYMHVLMPMQHPPGCGVLPTATARQAVMVFTQAYKKGCVLRQCSHLSENDKRKVDLTPGGCSLYSPRQGL